MKKQLMLVFAFLLLLGSCSKDQDGLHTPSQNEQQKPQVSVEEELQQTVTYGGEIVLSGDVNLSEPLEISKSVTVNLNGKNIKNDATNVFVVEKGGRLTINAADNAGVIESSETLIWAKGGTVIINGGIYKAGHGDGRAVSDTNGNGYLYAGSDDGTNPGGDIIINSGVFEYTGSVSGGDVSLLNVADNDANNPTIVVKGGQFKNFNPGNNTAQGEGTNFVHEEYESVLKEGTTDVYEIVLKGFIELSDGNYEIRTSRGLYTFASLLEAGDNFANKTIKLVTDIDLNNEPWTPIGASKVSENAETCIFGGTLDGQGYAIKNLKIESDETYVGLFSSANGATFANLSIIGGDIVGLKNTYCIGALVGLGQGITVLNCHNQDCTVSLQEQMSGQAGGLVGYLTAAEIDKSKILSVMIACSNTATITSPYCPGGITGGGWGKGSTLVACYNTGSIKTTRDEDENAYGGGIVASFATPIDGDRNVSNYMYACFNSGAVSSGVTNGVLVGDIGFAGKNIYYSYSSRYVPSLCGQLWGDLNETVSYIKEYSAAVDNLNKGIELYNETATIPCNYRFVSGDTPQLQLK